MIMNFTDHPGFRAFIGLDEERYEMAPTPDEVARGGNPGRESAKGCFFVATAFAAGLILLLVGRRK